MVPFAGWSMPLSYGEVGQITAHNHVRTSAGLFDVSHMLQHTFKGASAQSFLSSLVPSSLSGLQPFTSTLSVLLNEGGGVIDDTIITKHDDNAFYVVTNAGRSAEDTAWIQQRLDAWNSSHSGEAVEWTRLEGWGLLALQGPRAADVLQGLTETDLKQIKFGQCAFAELDAGEGKSVRCHIARGGYTGEDGFEVCFASGHR